MRTRVLRRIYLLIAIILFMIGILVIFTGCASGMGSFLKMESQAPEIKTNEMPDEYLKDEMSIPYFMVTFIPDEVTLKSLKDNIREAIVYDEDINDIEKEKQLEKLDSLHYENKKRFFTDFCGLSKKKTTDNLLKTTNNITGENGGQRRVYRQSD